MHRIWCSYKSDGFFWFRLFGYGLCFKDITKHPLLYSERNGYKKTLKINNWSITFLKKWIHPCIFDEVDIINNNNNKKYEKN